MFNAIIINPPYDRNLHLKILETVIPYAEKVVNISPIRWLQDPFAPYNTRSDYCKFEDSISKKIESLDVIPAKDASKLFDVSFTMNLGIYVCWQGGYNYQHDDPLITKLVEKTMEHSWMPFNWKNYYNNDIQQKAYVLNVAGIHSASSKYPIMCQTLETQLTVEPLSRSSAFTGGNGIQGGHFEFDTEEERKNFYDCYNTAFMQWYIRLWKFDVHVVGYKLPYLGDYTTPWTNEKFKAYFELTDEEWTRVEKEMAAMIKSKELILAF